MHDLIAAIDFAEIASALTTLCGALIMTVGAVAGLLRALAALFKRTPITADDDAIPTLHRWADALDGMAAWLRPLLPQKPRKR